ncbi:MAG: permease-like cell division protein FtsX [Gallionella sp.]
MSMLSQHLAVAKTALRRIFASPLSGVLNILVIGIALSLPTGLYVLLQNAQSLSAPLAGPPQISLFLTLSSTSQEITALRQKLTLNTNIQKLIFISRATALENLRKTRGLNDVIAVLTDNPLPDAFIITLKLHDTQSLIALRNDLQNLPHVALAQLDTAWAEKLASLIKFADIFVLILASLLSLALIAITFNTIRLQVMTQRDEITVAQLIGATNAFIRRPFLYFGAMQGLLGGLAAWLILIMSLHLLSEPLATLSRSYDSDFTLQPLTVGDSISLIVFSLYLGWLGAWLSVSKHLSPIEPQ